MSLKVEWGEKGEGESERGWVIAGDVIEDGMVGC